jgi:hypothetical protein
MSSGATTSFRSVLEALEKYGLLLESDAQLPSLVSIVAGGPVRGSWWGHASGNIIYEVSNQLANHPDVLVIKLVSGKVTFVQRMLWPVVISIAIAREPWQLQDLSDMARTLLDSVTKEHTLRIDLFQKSAHLNAKALSDAARELERKLLIYGESVHTSSGAHTKLLETWEHWTRRTGFAESQEPSEQGKMALEDALLMLNRQFDAKGRLPWLAKAP